MYRIRWTSTLQINRAFWWKKGLKETQKRDKTKDEYCKNNNIRLLRIKYNEKVSKILSIL